VRTGGPRAAAPRTPHPPLRGTFPRKGGRESGGNCGQDAVELLKNLIVPEAEDAVAAALQESAAFGIIFHRFAMLAAIDLDDEPSGVTGDIRVVRPDRHLAAKVHSWKAPA
jgi:hypothetical protein